MSEHHWEGTTRDGTVERRRCEACTLVQTVERAVPGGYPPWPEVPCEVVPDEHVDES